MENGKSNKKKKKKILDSDKVMKFRFGSFKVYSLFGGYNLYVL